MIARLMRPHLWWATLASLVTLLGCDSRPTPVGPADGVMAFAKAGAGSTPAPVATAQPMSSTQIAVTWTDNSASEIAFDVWQSSGPAEPFAPLARTGPNVTNYLDAGLSAGTSHCYAVRSVHTERGRTTYSAFSAPACASTSPTPPPPTAPLGVFVEATSSTVAYVLVRDTASILPSYRVERGPSEDGPWSEATTIPAGVRDFVDAERVAEVKACYRAEAFNEAGASEPSPGNCVIPLAGPSGLSATVVGHEVIDLAWLDNSSHEKGYRVEWAASEAGPYTERYLASNSTAFRVTGLNPSTRYWFRVRANGDYAMSDYSSLISATTVSRPTPDAAPSPAFGLSGRPDYSSILITWGDTASNKQGARLERTLDGAGSWQTLIALTTNTRLHWDFDAPSETSVCYRIVSFNEMGETASDSACTAVPAAPWLSWTVIDANTVELVWNDASQFEDGYLVWDASNCGCRFDASVIAELPANATSFRIPLAAGQYGYYFVQPIKGGGLGPNSMIEEVTNTTPP